MSAGSKKRRGVSSTQPEFSCPGQPLPTPPYKHTVLPEDTCSTHGPIVSGIPKPEVCWFLEGIPMRRREGITEIYEDGASHHLCLLRARMKDSGRYSCTASNSLGQVSCSWTLLVDREYIALGVLAFMGFLCLRQFRFYSSTP